MPYATADALARFDAAIAAAVTDGQVTNVVADTDLKVLKDYAQREGIYEGHSRDKRTAFETLVVNYIANVRNPVRHLAALNDSDERTVMELVDEMAEVVSLADRAAKAHDADAADIVNPDPDPDTADTPAEEPAKAKTPRQPRGSTKTFNVADQADGHYTCIGACGKRMPVKAFFPTVKGGATRTMECNDCANRRRAAQNPDSALARSIAAADAKRAERAAAKAAKEAAAAAKAAATAPDGNVTADAPID